MKWICTGDIMCSGDVLVKCYRVSACMCCFCFCFIKTAVNLYIPLDPTVIN